MPFDGTLSVILVFGSGFIFLSIKTLLINKRRPAPSPGAGESSFLFFSLFLTSSSAKWTLESQTGRTRFDFSYTTLFLLFELCGVECHEEKTTNVPPVTVIQQGTAKTNGRRGLRLIFFYNIYEQYKKGASEGK